MFETALETRLTAISANTYALVAPDDYVTPAVVWTRIGTRPVKDMDGITGAGFIHLQVSVYDPALAEAIAMATTIRDNLLEWEDDDVFAVDLFADDYDTYLIDNTTKVTLYHVAFEYLIYAKL